MPSGNLFAKNEYALPATNCRCDFFLNCVFLLLLGLSYNNCTHQRRTRSHWQYLCPDLSLYGQGIHVVVIQSLIHLHPLVEDTRSCNSWVTSAQSTTDRCWTTVSPEALTYCRHVLPLLPACVCEEREPLRLSVHTVVRASPTGR